MAKVAARGTRVWLDGYALSTSLTAATLKLKQEALDVGAFADAGPRRLVGNFDHAGDFSGLFDAAVGELDPTLATLFADGADHYLAVAFGSAAEGDGCKERVTRLEEKPIEVKKGQAVLLNFTAQGSGILVPRATIVRTATVTGTGNGTGYNVGASTSGQVLVATFRLIAVAGGAITLKVQDSSDNGAVDPFADVAGLTSGSLTTAGAVVQVTTTAATKAYKRVVVSTMTASSATVLVTVGVAAGT